MAKGLTTTEISRLSGVSRGTVDRILHNRGNVSENSAQKVMEVLEKYGYKYNLHTSAVPFRKVFHLLVCLPKYSEEDFWSQIRRGIKAAIRDYSDIDIDLTDMDFSPFDGTSYLENFIQTVEEPVDGIIMSPVFPEESRIACRMLDEKHIPYVFVDKTLDDTAPLAVFSIDQFAGGHLAAGLVDSLTAQSSQIGIFFADKARGHNFSNTSKRDGVESYFSSEKRKGGVFFLDMDIISDEGLEQSIRQFMKLHPDIKGIAVTNAHGAKVAGCLKKLGCNDVTLVSFDLTKENSEKLEDGEIKALICQRPETQGYKATIELLQYFLYKKTPQQKCQFLPIDIVFKENLPWYKDLDL